MGCHGGLAGEWWTNKSLLVDELEAHDNSNVAAGDAHGVNESTIRRWRKQHGIPPNRPDRAKRVVSVPDVTGEVSEVEVLRQRNTELEKIVTRARKEDVLYERMILTLKQSIQSVEPKYNPAVIPTSHRKADEHEMALLWSDTHAGEIVSSEETNGLNEYDWDIMLQRHDEILRGVLSYKENRPYPVKKLHVWALGDMLSGDIHEELQQTNEFPIIECAIRLGLDGGQWLERLVPEFEAIDFAGVVGNHPRLSRKQPSKGKFNNFDWLVYHTMQQRLAQHKSISWEIPKAQKWPVMVFDRRVLLFHGDGIRSTMTDVPWGGIIRYVNKLTNQYASAGKPVDHFACGHYHEANAVKNRRIIMNGSVKGLDEYSVDAFGGGERPTQVLLTFHRKRGLTDVSYIDLAA